MSEKQVQPQDFELPPFSIEEIMSSIIDYDDYKFLLKKKKKTNIKELERQAYYKVVHAFRAECPAISTPRVMIIVDLKKQLKISRKTHFELEDKIKTEPLVKRWRNASKASNKKKKQKVTNTKGHPVPRVAVKKEDLLKFQERLNAAPATIQDENAKPSSSSEDSLVPSWGQVSPKSLVGRWVNIRMPGEDDYSAFYIKGYNEVTEMHHLVTALSRRTYIDPLDWIDIRHIPAEDIVWQDGHPGFPARKCSLIPGETILGTTSTSQDKKQIIEVGKSANGIPIIRKLQIGERVSPVQ